MADNERNLPAEMWAQSFRTWMEGWSVAMTGGAAGGAGQADPIALWRRSVDQWLGAWGTFFEQTLYTPEAAQAGGRALDNMLNIEKPLRERTAAAMQFWLEFINMPSRSDLIRVAVALNDANDRLDELQEQVETLNDQVADLSDVGTAGRQGGAA